MPAGLLVRKEFELHPEGPVVLTLADYDGPKPGNYGPQITWKFDSTEEREDGEMFSIHFWTGTNLSSDPRNKLGKLLTAFGFNIETIEVEELDLDDLIGKKVQAMIVHGLDAQKQMRANIDSLVPLRRKPRPDSDEKAKAVSVAAAGTESGGDRKAADPDWDQPD